MIDYSLFRRGYKTLLSSDDTTDSDCPLWNLCESVADDFVRACLNADDPHQVRRRMQQDICASLNFEPARAEALLELALEALHLRSEGQYQSELTEIACLMARVTGGDETLSLS